MKYPMKIVKLVILIVSVLSIDRKWQIKFLNRCIKILNICSQMYNNQTIFRCTIFEWHRSFEPYMFETPTWISHWRWMRGTPRKRRARSSFLARTGVKRQRRCIRERRIVITEAGLKTRGSIRPCEARSSISIVVSGSRRCLPLSTPAISFYWYRLREKFIGSAQRPDRSSIPTKIEEKPRRILRGCSFAAIV